MCVDKSGLTDTDYCIHSSFILRDCLIQCSVITALDIYCSLSCELFLFLSPFSYASCYVNRLSLPVQSFTHPVAHKLRKLMRRLQGAFSRLLMFGSGLESVPLVKTMLWEPQSPYKPTGLFPGKDGTPHTHIHVHTHSRS